MLFGVKANVGSNPTVTANTKGPASLLNKGKQDLLLYAAAVPRVIGQDV